MRLQDMQFKGFMCVLDKQFQFTGLQSDYSILKIGFDKSKRGRELEGETIYSDWYGICCQIVDVN